MRPRTRCQISPRPTGGGSRVRPAPPGPRGGRRRGWGRARARGVGGVRTRGLAPAAGMASNVRDLAKYVAMQFRTGPAGGAQVLSGASLREMQRVHWLNPGWPAGRGIGFQVRRAGERTLVGHGGSLPGMRTQVTFDARDKIGVIVLTNA